MTNVHLLFARLLLCVLGAVAVVSCGSGAVSAPPAPITPSPLSVSPSSATLYSELPTSFTISGGTAPYFVTSSDQATVPVIGSVAGTGFTVIPNPVAADSQVTLTVRDSGTATPVNASLTVKPRTVSNIVTIIPSASQPAACGTAVCAGGDAEVNVRLSQNGLPLAGRQVRFDVISGDVRIITSAPGVPEQLSLSGTTQSDNAGVAAMRVRVLADAGSQTALLQVTDVSSGFTQRTSVTIAPSSSAPLNAQPNAISFRSVITGQCANGLRADVIVFGGRPPYSISQPGTFDVSPTVVDRSGGRFTITAIGACTPGSLIAVVDSAGASVTVTVTSTTIEVVGVPAPPLVVAPDEVTLDSCNAKANVVIAGGSGSYFASSGNSGVSVGINGDTGTATIQRAPRNVADLPLFSPVTVAFSDGATTAEVTVNLTGSAVTGTCQ